MTTRALPHTLALACVIVRAALADEVTIHELRHPATGGDWARDGSNRIAYCLMESDHYVRVHLMDPDGGNDVSLGGTMTGLPRRHVGPAVWHPSMRYLGVIAEKTAHPGSSMDAFPGFGGYSDLWVVAADGTWSARLVEEPDDYDHGPIFPFFSPDGRRMSWTERVAAPDLFDARGNAGFWVIRVADVIEVGGVRHLEHIATLDLGRSSFNEGYGFSLDGSAIVWMSTEDNLDGSTDWCLMKPDGDDKRRISYMNVAGHNGYDGTPHYAGFGSFDREGGRFIGGYQTNLLTQDTHLAIVDLPASAGGPSTSDGVKPCGTGGASGLILGGLAWLALALTRRRAR